MPLSTNVISLTPHPINVRATAQPSVPAPNNKHFKFDIASVSKLGNIRHLINFTFKSAIFIGIFQILSLIPGVSRSGIAITAARFLKFDRVNAAKISFLLSIPTLLAVSVFGIYNIYVTDNFDLIKLNFSSIILSFIFSYITMVAFLGYIKKASLDVFVLYRIVLGVLILIFAYQGKL